MRVVASALLVSWTSVSHADPGTFSWTRARGADECPSRARLLAELSTALGRPLEDALDGRALDAMVEHDGSGWTVSLFWRAIDGVPAGTRILHDSTPSCDAIVRTTRTSILIALGANAVEVTAGSSSAPSLVSSSPSSHVPSPAPVGTASPSPSPPSVPSQSNESRPVAPGDVSLGALLAVGWLPVPAYGVQLVAEPAVYGRLRIALVASTLAEVAANFGSIQTGFAAAEFGVDACGMVFHLAPWVDTIACAGARAGVVQAFVYNNPQIAGGARGSFAAEVTAMLRLAPVGPAVVEIGAIGRANFTQYTLPIGTPTMPPLYTQSVGAFITTIRLGVHF